MNRRKTLSGVLLVAAALCVMTVVAVMTFPTGQKEEGGEHGGETQKHAAEKEVKPIESVAGHCFQNGETRFYFYTDRYVVIIATGTNEFDGTFEQRNWYEYRIHDGILSLKNGEDAFSCPFMAESDAIVVDGERYAVSSEKNQDEHGLIGRTYTRGDQRYQFISDDTVVVELKGEKTREAWGYAIEGDQIIFTFGTGGAEEKRKFEVTEKGIRMDGEVYGKE